MLIRRQASIRWLFNDAGGGGGGGERGGEDERWLSIFRVLWLGVVVMSIHATAIQSLQLGSEVPVYDRARDNFTLVGPSMNDTRQPLSPSGPSIQPNSVAPLFLQRLLPPQPVRRSASAAGDSRGVKEDGSSATGEENPTPAADKLTMDVRSFETGSEMMVGHRRRLDTSPQFPVTFRTSGAYLVTKLKVYATFGIQFKLKTTQLDGLILYSGYGFGKDFMAVELSAGHLRYIFDVGSGPRTVEARSSHPLNDNDWHDVSILRPTVSQHVVRVDETSTVDNLPDTRSVHYDLLADDLYIGGVGRSMYNSGQLPKQVRSRIGFQGCLASVDLNKQCWNIDEHHADIPKEFKDFVTKGCEDSIAYTFGQLGGVISFTFAENERPDTKTDQLTMGFSTTQLDALLLRVSSATSNDFIEVELIDGALYVVYNMGINNHPIGDIDRKVNDGNYHVLRFARNGQNASIQIDSFPPLSKHPPGRQLMTTFNHQGSVLIGGKKEGSRLIRPFHGVIAGLVLNRVWLLELAAEGDRRITIEGDVELEISPLRSYYISLASEFSTRSVELTFLRPTNKPSSHQITTSSFNNKHVPKGSQSDSASDLSAVGSHCKDGDDQCIQDISKAPVNQPHQKATPPPPSGKSLTSSASTVPGRVRGGSSLPPCVPGGVGFREEDLDDEEDCDQSSGIGAADARRSLQSPTLQSPRGAAVYTAAGAFSNVSVTTPNPRLRGSTPREGPSLQSPDRSTDGAITLPASVGPPRPTRSASSDPGHGHNLEGSVGPPAASSKGKSNSSIDGSRDTERTGTADLKGSSSSLTPGVTGSMIMNIGLIAGISVGVLVLLLVLSCAVYKWRSREEGTYSLEAAAANDYGYEACVGGTVCDGERRVRPSRSDGGGQTTGKTKKRQTKEWYV